MQQRLTRPKMQHTAAASLLPEVLQNFERALWVHDQLQSALACLCGEHGMSRIDNSVITRRLFHNLMSYCADQMAAFSTTNALLQLCTNTHLWLHAVQLGEILVAQLPAKHVHVLLDPLCVDAAYQTEEQGSILWDRFGMLDRQQHAQPDQIHASALTFWGWCCCRAGWHSAPAPA